MSTCVFFNINIGNQFIHMSNMRIIHVRIFLTLIFCGYLEFFFRKKIDRSIFFLKKIFWSINNFYSTL